MAISDTDCPRLPPSEALTVPIIKLGEEIPQLILDVRTVEAYRWTSVIVLYDDTLSNYYFFLGNIQLLNNIIKINQLY